MGPWLHKMKKKLVVAGSARGEEIKIRLSPAFTN